jgi:hypothetical protein
VAAFRRGALVKPADVLEPLPGVGKVLVAHLAIVAGDVDARVFLYLGGNDFSVLKRRETSSRLLT